MKYDIELRNPFGLGLEIIDVEDRLPSFECHVTLWVEFYGDVFQYSSPRTWFECSVYDEFLSCLRKIKVGENTKAEFYDMSYEIMYVVTQENFNVSVHRISSKGSGYMEFTHEFDSDLLAQHIQYLETFPKWW